MPMPSNGLLSFWSLVPLLVFIGGCSDDDSSASGAGGPSTSVTQTVGPDGATLELDGATVTFPPGALSEPTSITIEATEEKPPEGFTNLSRIYKCAPSGLSFDPKVTMNMEFSPDGKTPTMFWSSGSDPAFADVGGTVSGGSLKAEVAHFSRGFVGHNP